MGNPHYEDHEALFEDLVDDSVVAEAQAAETPELPFQCAACEWRVPQAVDCLDEAEPVRLGDLLEVATARYPGRGGPPPARPGAQLDHSGAGELARPSAAGYNAVDGPTRAG